jgi:hypothetical protein
MRGGKNEGVQGGPTVQSVSVTIKLQSAIRVLIQFFSSDLAGTVYYTRGGAS